MKLGAMQDWVSYYEKVFGIGLGKDSHGDPRARDRRSLCPVATGHVSSSFHFGPCLETGGCVA